MSSAAVPCVRPRQDNKTRVMSSPSARLYEDLCRDDDDAEHESLRRDETDASSDDEDDGYLKLLRSIVREEVERALDAREAKRQEAVAEAARQQEEARARVKAAEAELAAAHTKLAKAKEAAAPPPAPASTEPPQPSLTLREQAKFRVVAESGKYAPPPPTSAAGRTARARKIKGEPRKPRVTKDTGGGGILGLLSRR